MMEMTSKRLSVCIILPTYNEKNNIIRLIPEIEKIISEKKYDAEIIVIDDNSPDGTGKFADSFAKKYGNIKVIHRPGKMGVGSARTTGFSATKKDIIISMESDNTHDPKYIPLFINEIRKGADLVIGSRYLKKSKIVNWPLKRRFISKFANKLTRFFSRVKVSDVTNGYRAFTKEMYDSLYIESKSFSFNMEFVCEAWFRGYKISEIPITFINRLKGKSKMSFISEFTTFFMTAFRFSYLYAPMRVFGTTGFMISLAGVLIGIYLIIIKYFASEALSSHLPLIFLAVILVISGIQIISVGMVAEISSKFRREYLHRKK